MTTARFKIGQVRNPLYLQLDNLSIIYRSINLLYPYRLNAMALDPSKIAVSEDYIYSPGEIVFSLGLFRKINITYREDSTVEIKTDSGRSQLILHAVELMRSALRIKNGFNIEVNAGHEYKHTGFGSSSTLIAGIAVGINELYGLPIESSV